MRLRARLHRLELAAACNPLALPQALSATSEQRLAYRRGEGQRPPDPPCPNGINPADWASRLRVGRCIEDRATGTLPHGDYLPDLDNDERSYVDAVVDTIEMVGRYTQPSTGPGGAPCSCITACDVWNGIWVFTVPARFAARAVTTPCW